MKSKTTKRAIRTSLLGSLLANPLAVASLTVIVLMVLVAVFGPFLAPYDPRVASAADVLASPSQQHLLGADSAGRDILARLIWGARSTLTNAGITVAVAFAIGVPAGLAAGYWGGTADKVTSWIADLLMSIPNLVIVLAFITVIGPESAAVMLVFGVLFSPGPFRLTRTNARAVRQELYIDAAQVAGLSDLRIISRHVTRRVRSSLLIQLSMTAGVSIVIQSGLDFLGVGDPREARWGQMINDAFLNIYRAPTMMLWPGLAIGLTVAAFALFGTALRDELEPTATVRRSRAATVAPHEPLPSGPSGALLEVAGLSITHTRADNSRATVVRDVSFTVNTGEVVGLVGESGSGKSQTAFAILGLLPTSGYVSTGSAHFQGRTIVGPGSNPKDLQTLRGLHIGYVPQEPLANLDPSFTIGHQLVEPLRHHLRLNRTAARNEALSLLEYVGITEPRRTFAAYPHEISGGMAQRVLIAGAVSCSPSLLIADEPTTALDVTVQAEVLELLRRLQRESGMGLLMITHNLGVVADICDRVAVMKDGALVEQGTVTTIFDTPQHSYTRTLLASTLEGAPSRLELDRSLA
ncbi:dipeptide/oligopeptide/nickel ABC transporter permease/ATP-binding protein [Paenarthrobacter nicotinovorans]|uniref:dipeptide/oligopeptide/nickel ABC transporter permease/ATP-binding protein n=1 Tax=Paenarthrobacter nicotinovorans TaxID=29320 RepID=UPI0027D88A82|nr:dipeptide/oligopeptide/nickel ABC transporter permease/ATP-binding protein [Paenarthrobacter nicotinovorans]